MIKEWAFTLECPSGSLQKENEMGILDQLRAILGKNDAASIEADITPLPLERRARPRVNAREGTRVLVIDDSPTIVAVFRKILRTAGYVTLEAMDAERGVEMARTDRPDLIFLDIVLPGMNGFAALRHLRRAGARERSSGRPAISADPTRAKHGSARPRSRCHIRRSAAHLAG